MVIEAHQLELFHKNTVKLYCTPLELKKYFKGTIQLFKVTFVFSQNLNGELTNTT